MTEKKEMKQEMTEMETRALLEGVYKLDNENATLRGQNKHVFSIGVARLEVIPTGESGDLAQVFKLFTKFAKELEKLHGDKHLQIKYDMGDSPSIPHDGMIN